MKVVVVGGDARAHVLAHVLGRSTDDVVVSGGNAGTPNAVATPPEELDGDLFVISPGDRRRSTGWPTGCGRRASGCTAPAPTGRGSRVRRDG